MEMITLIGTVSPKEGEAGSHRRKRNVYWKDATENNGSLSVHDLASQNDTPIPSR